MSLQHVLKQCALSSTPILCIWNRQSTHGPDLSSQMGFGTSWQNPFHHRVEHISDKIVAAGWQIAIVAVASLFKFLNEMEDIAIGKHSMGMAPYVVLNFNVVIAALSAYQNLLEVAPEQGTDFDPKVARVVNGQAVIVSWKEHLRTVSVLVPTWVVAFDQSKSV
ncbi:hypothetical protein M433DRAFT_382 [Acidomyces richmondensis BFW]|nr:hypothetical protein M433DRAFT_382 [Acidomyces richmondensis BFW]